MEKTQDLEWAEAQHINLSVNLVAAAKQQLNFLAAVDRNRSLYEGPALLRAIHRYKHCWLPLLSKQAEFGGCPLVVPLDCEWVWHCHRLNPLCYKADCEELYGRILGTANVVSSVEGTSTKQTEEIWNRFYPNEAYHVDLASPFYEGMSASKSTSYDLVSAVKRQSTFFYQVSRPHMSNGAYLEDAVARYKAFLHLIRKNMQSLSNSFCVPTYDIDLIWHSHQLHPDSYCKDTILVLGRVLEHDDTDSDRGEGKKLDVGFSETTRQWKETFGLRYWRAGARYRGPAPAPLMIDSLSNGTMSKRKGKDYNGMVKLPKEFHVEVLLEIVGLRTIPSKPGGKLFLRLTQKQKAQHLKTEQKLITSFQPEEKQVVSFHCSPRGMLIFELVSSSTSELSNSQTTKVLGTASISLNGSKLSEERFLELMPPSEVKQQNPMTLHISLSLTPPVAAPYMLFIAPVSDLNEDDRWMQVLDKAGSSVISIQMKGEKEMVGLSESGEMQILAESVEEGWSLLDSEWSFCPAKKQKNNNGCMHELRGERKVVFMSGRRLEYEVFCGTRRNEQDFMTAVEVSSEYPHGKAVALFDLKTCALEVKEEWFLLPGIVSTCILASSKESNIKDLGKGKDLLLGPRGFRLDCVNENELMAHCMGTGCGGGGCGGGCGGGGGCRGGGCHGGGCGGGGGGCRN